MMFYFGSKKKLFEKYKAEFAQYAYDRKPFTHASMEYAYTDTNGLRYFRFPDSLKLPLERFGKMKEFLMWIASGITPAEMDKLIDMGLGALDNGMKAKGSRSAGVIGFVFEELKSRRKLCVHTELLYNFLACQWVREDEDPTLFNNEIQLQKVAQFKEEVRGKDSYFFFQNKELKWLHDKLNLSQSEWIAYWEDSLIQQQSLEEMIQIISSDQKYSNSMSQEEMS